MIFILDSNCPFLTLPNLIILVCNSSFSVVFVSYVSFFMCFPLHFSVLFLCYFVPLFSKNFLSCAVWCCRLVTLANNFHTHHLLRAKLFWCCLVHFGQFLILVPNLCLYLSLFLSNSHFHSALVCHCIAKIHIVFLCIFVSLTFFFFHSLPFYHRNIQNHSISIFFGRAFPSFSFSLMDNIICDAAWSMLNIV